jgi:hypothetical protein
MRQYCVRCQSASGQTRDAYVHATSERRAMREALRTLEALIPGAGWLPVWALAQ